MKIIVNPHKCEIDRTLVNEKEINVSKCEFVFSEEIPSDYVKEAYFTLNGTTYKQLLFNNECDIPNEVLEKKGTIEIGVVAYEIQNEQYVKRFNPSPCYQDTLVGSLKDEFENSEEITPSDKEQIINTLNDGLNQIDNLDIEAEKVGTTTTIIITKKDGTTETTQVLDGNGIASITTQESQVDEGNNVITITDTNGQVTTFIVKNGSKGNTGAPGQIKMLIVNELPLTGSGDTLYFVPKNNPEQEDLYDEYVWLNNHWEPIGEKQITIDLSDYYTKQETNTLLDEKANTSDIPRATSDLLNDNNFVEDTDYATNNVGGVIKTSVTYGTGMSNGSLIALTKDYSNYQNGSNQLFISKSTLENVITGKELVNKTYVDNLVGDISSAIDLINGESV